VISLIIGIAAGVLYLGGGQLTFALAGVLVFLSSIFDSADGMLARSQNRCTRFGLFLDLFCDRIVDFAILTGIALGYYFDTGNLLMSALALLNIGIYFLQVTLLYLIKQYTGSRKSGDASEARGLSLFVIMLLSLLNRLDLIILAVLTTIVLSTVSKIIQLFRLSTAE
jgi:phosphatidylglycerophosphate synthase